MGRVSEQGHPVETACNTSWNMQASIHGEGAFDKPGSSIIPRNVFLATLWKSEPIANFF